MSTDVLCNIRTSFIPYIVRLLRTSHLFIHLILLLWCSIAHNIRLFMFIFLLFSKKLCQVFSELYDDDDDVFVESNFDSFFWCCFLENEMFFVYFQYLLFSFSVFFSTSCVFLVA
uniref:Uncharacterized protein n=1 Tax=Cacopsylla melanoneura TaxID=428564 RepID=A0A8D8ZCJ0_9HEMI